LAQSLTAQETPVAGMDFSRLATLGIAAPDIFLQVSAPP
jgi:hypothetical protein